MRDALREAWDAYAGYPPNESTKRWCRRLNDLGSALLPFRGASGEAYLASIAKNAAEWRILQYVIRQAFTPDMLDYIGDPAAGGSVSTPLRKAMEDAGVGHWRLHRIKDPEAVRPIYSALNMVEEHRPTNPGSFADSTGRIMRRFRNAVERGDDAMAQGCLQELRSRKLTDVHNVRFLDAWRVARLAPRELARSEELARALGVDERLMPVDLRRVLGTTVLEHSVAELLEREGAESLRSAIASEDPLVPASLVQRCKILVTPIGACYRVLAHLRTPEASVTHTDFEQASGQFAWIAQLRELVAVTDPVDPGVGAGLQKPPAEEDGERRPASSALQDRPLGDVCAAVQAGQLGESGIYWLSSQISRGDRQAEILFDQWWDQLSPEERQEWGDTTRHTRAKSDAEQAAEHPTYSDWTAWMEAGSETGDFSYEAWPLVADVASDHNWSRFERALSRLDERTFRDNLPAFLRAWESDVARRGAALPRRVVNQFCDTIWLALLVDENALSSGDAVHLLHDFLQLALSEIETQAYGQIVHQLCEVVEKVKAHTLLAELVDVLELLVDRKQPDVQALNALLRAFQMAAQKHSSRMDPTALSVLCELLEFRDMSADAEALRASLPPKPEVNAAEAEAIPCPVRGKRILIYTLETPSGERAKDAIEELYGAEVRTNADYAASAKLKGALDWAEIVICVTRAAQHAASNEVDRATPQEMLIRPRGKGTSSILRDLAVWREKRMQGEVP